MTTNPNGPSPKPGNPQPPTSADAHHDEEPLARAIRRGITCRPEQAFGEYYHGRRASCALGAAYEGLYRLPLEVQGIVPKDLYRFYECLDFVVKSCPAGCRKRLPLGALIVHLNDDHRWSREQVADWLVSVAPSAGFGPGSGSGQPPA